VVYKYKERRRRTCTSGWDGSFGLGAVNEIIFALPAADLLGVRAHARFFSAARTSRFP